MVLSKGNIDEYITSLRGSRLFCNDIACYKVIPEKKECLLQPEIPFSRDVDNIIDACGVKSLYSHQSKAICEILKGRCVVVSTPTASGKTIVYNIPVFEKITENKSAKALYLFPLKALAQDQLKTFEQMASCLLDNSPGGAIYNGDTTPWFRKKIRTDPPNVIFTNPDMLHYSILAYHEKWAAFLSELEFVVVDEVHTYRGIFGAHISNVFMRLSRVCEYYGKHPQFIMSSATISNPKELAENLTGLPFVNISESGAPRGKKHVVFINPISSGPAGTAIQLLKAALSRNLRTIIYTKSRKMTELISIWAGSKSGRFSGKISAYRAGLLPEERRKIEQDLSSGDILAVISTSALELGIDIGDLDLCILVGYPGSVMSTWQRAGRVGRGGQNSAVIMIAGDDALDQYYMRNPEIFFKENPESAVLNKFNKDILKQHLICAAAEIPVKESESFMAKQEIRVALDELEKDGRLLRNADGSELFPGEYNFHRKVDLRGTGDRFAIICQQTGNTKGEIDGFMAFRETHPGAVYLHQGESYVVTDLDILNKVVRVIRSNVDYYTKVNGFKSCEILEIKENKNVYGCNVSIGRIRVTDKVTGYDKWRVFNRKKMGSYNLDLPPHVFETDGVWMIIPNQMKIRIEKDHVDILGSIHAIEHALIGMMPIFILTDRNDLGGISTPFHQQTGGPSIFVYDGIPGGAGLSHQAFDCFEPLLQKTFMQIKNCHCDKGCPSCVHSPKCGSGNDPIDKHASLHLLELIRCGEEMSVPEISSIEKKRGIRKTVPIKFDTYCVFDIETKYSAEEVGGWHNAHKMEISCIVCYDSTLDGFVEYTENGVDKFIERIRRTDLVVGFNNKRFDNKVLSGYSAFDMNALRTLDLLEDIYKKIGYRVSLDHLAKINLGKKKSAGGLDAIRWWREGKIGKIIQYCKDDVQITRDLFQAGKQNGYLLYQRKKEILRVPVDW